MQTPQRTPRRRESPDESPEKPLRPRLSEEAVQLFRQAGLGVWELDVTNKVYHGDETTLMLLGIHGEDREFRVEDVYARLAPEAPDIIVEKIAEATSNHLEEQSFDMAVVGDDGTSRWIRVCARNEFDETGRLAARYGTVQDVSDEPRSRPWDPFRKDRLTSAIRGAKVIPWEYDLNHDTFTIDPISRDDAEFPTGVPIALATLLERIHPEDRGAIASLLERQRRDPTRILYAQYRLRTREGGWKWVLARGEHRTAHGEGPERIYGVNVDISSLRDTLFTPPSAGPPKPRSHAKIGHWELSLQTSAMAISPDLSEMLGLDAEKPYTLEDITRIILPEDRPIVFEALEEGRNPHGVQGGEISLRVRVRGEVRWFRATAVVTQDDAGNPLALVGVALDMTELTREDEMLRESYSAAEKTANLSTLLEWEFEPRTGVFRGRGRLKEVLFGTDFEGCALTELLNQLGPEERWTLSRCLAGADGETTTRTAQTRFRREDGSVFQLRTYAWTAEAADKRPVRRQGIIQDITRRVDEYDELRLRADALAGRLAQLRIAASKACCWAWDYEADRVELLPCPQSENPLESLDRGPLLFDRRQKTLLLKPAAGPPGGKPDRRAEPPADADETPAEDDCVRAWGLLPEADAGREDPRRPEWDLGGAAYWEYDPEQDCFRGGARLGRFLRLEEGEDSITRARLDELIHPEDRREVLRTRRRILQERPSEAQMAFRIVLEGRIRHVVAYAHQEFDAEGALVFQSGVLTDVTERERIDAAVLRIASEAAGENWEEFLRRITVAVAEIVSADAVTVAHKAPAPGRMRTLVSWEDGMFRAEREFDSASAPAEVLGGAEYRLVMESGDDSPALGCLENRRGVRAYAALAAGAEADENEIQVLLAFRGAVEEPRSLGRVSRLYAARVAANLKRYHAESRLRESEGLFREMAENSIFAIRILRGDRYVYANSRYREILGRADADIIGHRVSEFVDETTWDEIRYRLNRARIGIVETFDQRIRLKSGKETWLRGYARPINYRGEPAFMAVFMDISDRKRLEDELRQAVDRFTLGVKAGRMDVWELNLRTGACVYQCNGSNEGAFPPGISRFRTDEYLAWIHPDDRAMVREQFDPIAAGTTRTYAAEYRIKTPNSRGTRWISAVAEVVKWDAAGRPLLLVGMQRDFTEEREARLRLAEQSQQLQHSQKMDAIGQLAGGVAHEFNNLLQVISGYGELLKEVVKDQEAADEYLDAVFSASRRGTELVRQLLQFSHKEAPRSLPVELGEIVKGMRDMLCRVLGENIRLDFIRDDERIVIPADEGQLRQVLMNLCINARDAIGPRDGLIRIRLRRETLGEEAAEMLQVVPGEYAVVSVEDDGPGVAPEVHEKIFEPFFTTKEIGKGTGLGLSAVHGIVEHHRGAIRLESPPGSGATFHVYLPARIDVDGTRSASEAGRTVEARIVAPATSRVTALVAEDDPAVLEFAQAALRNLGIRAITAGNGLEAVKRYQSHRDEIDLLFFDVLMPEMTGPAAYERIREIGGDAPVIFATGRGTATDALPEGTGAVLLPKPYSGRTLQEAIESVLVAY